MKFSRSSLSGAFEIDNKIGKKVALLTPEAAANANKLIGQVDLAVGLSVDAWKEEQLNKLFSEGLPIVYQSGEYEAGDVVIAATKLPDIVFALLTVDRVIIAYVVAAPAEGWSADEISEAEVVIGTPAAIAPIYSKINGEHVILLGADGLAEFKQTTGVSELLESKSVKLNIKPGQELMGVSTKVYVL